MPYAAGMPTPDELPPHALLARYRLQGAYADCYVATVPGRIAQADYVAAFYTTRLFKLERLLLGWLARRPATDAQAIQLSLGQTERFSAWHVEARAADQLLMRDFMGRTRSWLMSTVDETATPVCTRLYFGSAVVPKVARGTGQASFGLTFHALKGFHHLYSKALLGAARARLLALSQAT